MSQLFSDFPGLKAAKDRAEQSMKEGNYAAAFMQWSEAITMIQPRVEPSFHVQRCKCFTLLGQYYLALEDAQIVLNENPESIQGYLRKAEIYFAAFHFEEAHKYYLKCFQLSLGADKENYMDLARRCKKEMLRQSHLTRQYPWLGAAVGIVVGVLGILLHLIQSEEANFAYPFVKVGLVILAAVLGYFFAKWQRHQTLRLKAEMLENPRELFLN